MEPGRKLPEKQGTIVGTVEAKEVCKSFSRKQLHVNRFLFCFFAFFS